MPTAYALIHEQDGVFGVSFPDFPGAITTARSADDALRKAGEMLTFHVSGMTEDGDPLPMLRSLAELQGDRQFRADAKDATLVLVPFELPGRSVRINISIDENLLSAVDQAAEASGQSRSMFLAEAARARLRAS